MSTWLRRPLAWLPIRDLDRVARADVALGGHGRFWLLGVGKASTTSYTPNLGSAGRDLRPVPVEGPARRRRGSPPDAAVGRRRRQGPLDNGNVAFARRSAASAQPSDPAKRSNSSTCVVEGRVAIEADGAMEVPRPPSRRKCRVQRQSPARGWQTDRFHTSRTTNV